MKDLMFGLALAACALPALGQDAQSTRPAAANARDKQGRRVYEPARLIDRLMA